MAKAKKGDGSDVRTRNFELAPWQIDAVAAWERGTANASHTGTLEVFTGGGKTLLALACAERASALAEDLHLAVVVPTEALAHQWIDSLVTHTELARDDIGLLGAGGHDTLDDHRALVAVLNSAAKHLPDAVHAGEPRELLLVVDECHRAGAPSYSRVLRTPARFRLGLSATPDREEVDEDGEPLTFDEQLVGRLLGPVVFRFSLKDAREAGWLPDYQIHHHAIGLHDDERRRYDEISRKIDDLADELSMLGVETSQARSAARRNDDAGRVAAAWVAATARRKDLLYRAGERQRVATRIVLEALKERPGARALLFHERVDEATALHRDLVSALPDTEVVVEHSRLPQPERREALQRFRDGDAPVLVSVRSLIEGIDVPEADTGVSVASSSSVRQRIQSLGRVLRRSRTASESKLAMMHVLYVRDSVDDLIYAKEDWSDLTGEAQNIYWSWPLDPAEPRERLPGPPHTPAPTEDQEWERLGSTPPSGPVRWLGQWPSNEYSIDTRGTVRNRLGNVVANPQDIASLVGALRGRVGGRFGVTAVHRFVIVRSTEPPRDLYAVGCLSEPLALREPEASGDVDLSALQPGHEYPGNTKATEGKYKLAQKRGGVIERRTRSGAQFALTSGSGYPDLERNAATVLEAWRSVGTTGMQFIITESGDAVYWDGGTPRFLAHVPNGFAWPAPPAEPTS